MKEVTVLNGEIIEKTEVFVKSELGHDPTGHDWFHIERVRRNALSICKQEQLGDRFIIELAALLHDIPDEKLNDSAKEGQNKLENFLQRLNIQEDEKIHIKQIINTISFKGGQENNLTSIEAKIVQDADRLDAIGAVGIARVFAYGGKKGQLIFDPAINIRENMTVEEYRKGKSSSVHHFYEKLLKLKDLMNTDSAKQMAVSRHQMMESFLRQFYNEWDGNT